MLSLRKKSVKRKRLVRFLPLYLFMLPGLLYIIINNYLPMFGIVIAFKKMDYRKGIWGSPWVGLQNFEFLFKTKDAWSITRNTICYNLVFIVLGTFTAIAVAIMLNEIKLTFMRKIYQTVILIPFMLSIVIVSYLVYGFLSQESGYINKAILEPLGIRGISWYVEARYWPVILVIVNLWKGFGYSSIIYFATIVGIDKTYYESAAIDGAGRWKQITSITLPILRPTIIIMTLMSVSKIFYSDFGLFYQIPRNSGPLIEVTNTIDTYVYRGLIKNNNVGMASAAGFYQAIVGFVLVFGANYLVKRIDRDNSLF